MNKIIEILTLLKDNIEAETLEESIIFCKELYEANENLWKDMSLDETIEMLQKMFS